MQNDLRITVLARDQGIDTTKRILSIGPNIVKIALKMYYEAEDRLTMKGGADLSITFLAGWVRTRDQGKKVWLKSLRCWCETCNSRFNVAIYAALEKEYNSSL